MTEQLEKYRGYLVRHPARASLAIDPRPFGYLDTEAAAYRRLLRAGAVEGYRSEHESYADVELKRE